MLTFIAVREYYIQKNKGSLLFHTLLPPLRHGHKGLLPHSLLIYQVINVTVTGSIFLIPSPCTTQM